MRQRVSARTCDEHADFEVVERHGGLLGGEERGAGHDPEEDVWRLPNEERAEENELVDLGDAHGVAVQAECHGREREEQVHLHARSSVGLIPAGGVPRGVEHAHLGALTWVFDIAPHALHDTVLPQRGLDHRAEPVARAVEHEERGERVDKVGEEDCEEVHPE